ncbi:MAG: hypothetical protein EON56_04675 [Alphaproteobacteria bacterium]|nr:MAG: hypothetical protein EON56_04675 [Alphaproteobacteria bacterium]
MTPSKFIDYQERRLKRDLTPVELQAVLKARADCESGKRDTVRAMRAALNALLLPHELSPADMPGRRTKAAAD